MNTLQVGDGWAEERPGGLNRYFANLMRSLPAAGVQARGLIVGSELPAQQTDGAVISFAPKTDPTWKRVLRARQAIETQLRTERFDLFVPHFALYAALLGRRARHTPTVVHFHGPWAAESNVESSAQQRSSLKFRMENSLYSRARSIIVLSRAFQRELLERYGVEESITRVVPGGVDTLRFHTGLTRAEARQRLGWPLDRPIIVGVRRLVRRMGLENLISAMSTIVKTHPEALLYLGGTGHIAGELAAQIESLGLSNSAHLLGRVSEEQLPLVYRAADLTVVPSQHLEGFGLITLESLASGTPVLVTPVGGLPEIIQPFAPQCVLADTSVEALTDALHEILRGDRVLPSETACRAYAEQFAWPSIAGKIAAVYAAALR